MVPICTVTRCSVRLLGRGSARLGSGAGRITGTSATDRKSRAVISDRGISTRTAGCSGRSGLSSRSLTFRCGRSPGGCGAIKLTWRTSSRSRTTCISEVCLPARESVLVSLFSCGTVAARVGSCGICALRAGRRSAVVSAACEPVSRGNDGAIGCGVQSGPRLNASGLDAAALFSALLYTVGGATRGGSLAARSLSRGSWVTVRCGCGIVERSA